jgi:hypothetical protein
MRTWCVSTDPEFAAKAAEVVGLSLAPLENAVVISVDEKPSIQALSRTAGHVVTHNGKFVRTVKSTYRRNGRGASFDSTTELVIAIETFIKHYNEIAEPFVWKKREIKGTQIHDTLSNLRG